MSEWLSELGKRLVVGRKRDGRCVYDEQAKQELVIACRKPGMSIARIARECGINANQLSAWIRRHDRASSQAIVPVAIASKPSEQAFVPVTIKASKPGAAQILDLQASFPNGVVVDLRGCDMSQAGDLIQILGDLRCSASTKT
jgi:transposase